MLINYLLKGVFIILLFLSMYLSSSAIVSLFAENMEYSNWFRQVKDVLKISLTILLTVGYIWFIYQHENLLRSFRNWLIIIYVSFLISALFAVLFGNSNYFYLKYTNGFFIGILSFWFNRNLKSELSNIMTGITALLAVFLCELIEFYLIMDPSHFPTLLYLDSFSQTWIWFIIVLIVFLTAYTVSKGLIIKRVFRS